MSGNLAVGTGALTLEGVERVARAGVHVRLEPVARERIAAGRACLEDLLGRGERIYGVNTGVGGNAGFTLPADQMERLQENLVHELGCATGEPLPADVVRAAMLLRLATFATGASAVRPELADALIRLLNTGIVPVVPRYGSLGASGDLMPCAYVARVLMGCGTADYRGRRLPASDALAEAGIPVLRFAPKEALALLNGTTFMAASAALMWADARRVLRALLGAVALSLEALNAPAEPFLPWVHERKGHPGQLAVAAHLLALVEGSRLTRESTGQSCYSLRCVPQGLGPAWEGLEDARAVLEREINSASDNPLVDPETGTVYRAGNFYGGHMARLLDNWKADFAVMGNWGNSLMAVLVDPRFNGGLPANLVAEPGLNSGFKGMQLSITSLTCAIRQMAGPSAIHSLPTEQYNQDVVSLGMHAAVTAMDALECLRNETAMVLLAAVQAVELGGAPECMGRGTRRLRATIREVAGHLETDRAMEDDVRAVAGLIASGALNGVG